MTQAAAAVVRRQIVVDAPIERAFAVFTERFGDFKPPEHNLLARADRRDRVRAAGRRAHLRPRRGRQRVPLGARPRLRTAGPGGVQLGHRPAPGRSRPTRTTPARSRSGSSPRPRSAPASSWSTATSTGTAPAGRPSATASATTRAGRCTWTGTPPCSPRAADAADRHHRRGRPVRRRRCSPTPPTRPDSTSGSRASSTATWTRRGNPRSATRCLTTRRIGGAEPAEHLRGHPHRPAARPGACAASTDRSGPSSTSPSNRSTADRSRLTIAVDFTGHGIGKVLVPLVVRREAAKEMPANLATLKRRLEGDQP